VAGDNFPFIPERPGAFHRVPAMDKNHLAPLGVTSRGAAQLGAPAAPAAALTEYCDTAGAANLLGISASTLTKRRMDGNGPPFVKFSKLVRYHVPTLRAWAAAREHQSTSEYGRVA
jgi:hypothetical protein